MGRTLAELGASYDQRRNDILAKIRNSDVSASMSGIEYYPKPWSELDMNNDFDVMIISATLTYDGNKSTHEGLRKYSPRELELMKERSGLFFLSHEERKDRLSEIDTELNQLRVKLPR
jgi:hypothetical protein